MKKNKIAFKAVKTRRLVLRILNLKDYSGFQQLRLNRLEAAITADNKKSLRMAKKIGMKREGIRRRYWFENDH